MRCLQGGVGAKTGSQQAMNTTKIVEIMDLIVVQEGFHSFLNNEGTVEWGWNFWLSTL